MFNHFLPLHGYGDMGGLVAVLMMFVAVFFLVGVTALVLAIIHLVKASSGNRVHTGLKVTSLIFSILTSLVFLGSLFSLAQGEPAALLGGVLFLIPLILNIIAFNKEKNVTASRSDILDA